MFASFVQFLQETLSANIYATENSVTRPSLIWQSQTAAMSGAKSRLHLAEISVLYCADDGAFLFQYFYVPVLGAATS